MPSHRADGPTWRRHSSPSGGRHRPGWVRRIPEAAAVGVLALATVLAPLASDLLPGSGHTAEASSTAAAGPGVAQAPQAVTDFRVLPTLTEGVQAPEAVAVEVPQAPTAEELAAAREAADRASRELVRQALDAQALEAAVPGCDPAHVDVGAENGRLRVEELCELWGTGKRLRADAAVSFARLSFAYRDHFGTDIVITDSYRDYASQLAVRARKPGLAARPGTSKHGWGVAVDLGGGVEGADDHYAWLLEHAPAYGWDNPEWARRGGSGPYEPWHWEYVAGLPPEAAADGHPPAG